MSIHKIYALIFKNWRKKRFQLFVKTIRPSMDMRLLDVGGYPWGWLCHAPVVKSIDCLNIHKINWNPASSPAHNIRMLQGDACNMSEIKTGEYDIVFSNSVIEHVGSWEKQKAFAQEVRRVGKKLWIQTPAWECPIEPHYLAPFVHWLPKSLQKRVIRYFSLYGLIQKPSAQEIDSLVEEIRLLRLKEFQILFPDGNILTEKLICFFKKSYIALKK
jgi:hypothetical protein